MHSAVCSVWLKLYICLFNFYVFRTHVTHRVDGALGGGVRARPIFCAIFASSRLLDFYHIFLFSRGTRCSVDSRPRVRVDNLICNGIFSGVISRLVSSWNFISWRWRRMPCLTYNINLIPLDAINIGWKTFSAAGTANERTQCVFCERTRSQRLGGWETKKLLPPKLFSTGKKIQIYSLRFNVCRWMLLPVLFSDSPPTIIVCAPNSCWWLPTHHVRSKWNFDTFFSPAK